MDQSPPLPLLLLDSGDLRLDPSLLLTIQHRLSLLEVMSGHYVVVNQVDKYESSKAKMDQVKYIQLL